MSHKHDNLIRAIFHDPISGNLQWREVESLLRHLGSTVESLSGTRVRVKLNGHEGILHRPHGGNTLGRQDVQHLRENHAFALRGRQESLTNHARKSAAKATMHRRESDRASGQAAAISASPAPTRE